MFIVPESFKTDDILFLLLQMISQTVKTCQRRPQNQQPQVCWMHLCIGTV